MHRQNGAEDVIQCGFAMMFAKGLGVNDISGSNYNATLLKYVEKMLSLV